MVSVFGAWLCGVYTSFGSLLVLNAAFHIADANRPQLAIHGVGSFPEQHKSADKVVRYKIPNGPIRPSDGLDSFHIYI